MSKIRTSAVIFSRTGATSLQLAILLTLLVVLQGCAVVGDVLPPTLNLPMRATEMTVLEHGGKLIITFKLPSSTTEGMLIRRPPEIDLRIGLAPGDPNDVDRWAARATRIETTDPHADTPVQPWVNKRVAVSVRLLNEHGKDAGWTPLVMVNVVPPLDPPKDLAADSRPAGVHLKWNSSAPRFRVFRHLASGPGFEQIATPDKPEYDDPVELGKEYSYYVQAIGAPDGNAESENSESVSITPKDVFPPKPPVGLNFILGGKSIELTWTRNTESDLKGYRVYRGFENNALERVSDTQESTSYSDRNIEAGKHYRYAVTAIDLSGNESSQSEPVTVTAP